MAITRRALLGMGLAGLAALPCAFAMEATVSTAPFDSWRRGFQSGLSARMRAAGIPGVAVAIASTTSAHYSAAFGFADIAERRRLGVDTPMHLASVSKLVTSLGVVRLFERHGYDLHQDVNHFLDFSVRNPRHPDRPITVHQLLTHTSSISDEGYGDITVPGDSPQPLGEFLKSYLVRGGATYTPGGSFLNGAPGSRWTYSNVAMALAGHIVARIARRDFASCIEDDIFAPLGIRRAHWSIGRFAPGMLATPYEFDDGELVALPQQGYPDVPAGMLRCSVNDLATLLATLLGAPTCVPPIASPQGLRAMLQPQVDPSIASYQGLGWIAEEVNGRAVVGHSGSDPGASNMVALTEDRRHAAVVLMNVDGTRRNTRFRDEVTRDLLVGASRIA